jgi:hypothetical protein
MHVSDESQLLTIVCLLCNLFVIITATIWSKMDFEMHLLNDIIQQ